MATHETERAARAREAEAERTYRADALTSETPRALAAIRRKPAGPWYSRRATTWAQRDRAEGESYQRAQGENAAHHARQHRRCA